MPSDISPATACWGWVRPRPTPGSCRGGGGARWAGRPWQHLRGVKAISSSEDYVSHRPFLVLLLRSQRSIMAGRGRQTHSRPVRLGGLDGLTKQMLRGLFAFLTFAVKCSQPSKIGIGGSPRRNSGKLSTSRKPYSCKCCRHSVFETK